MASSSVSSIIADVYMSGARFVLQRETGSFYLDKIDLVSSDLLVVVEENKYDIFIAIGGTDGDIEEAAENNTGTSTDSGVSVSVDGLAEKLRERGVELQVYDEISHETLNRHYFHFTEKFDALAAAIESNE